MRDWVKAGAYVVLLVGALVGVSYVMTSALSQGTAHPTPCDKGGPCGYEGQ